MRRPRLLVGLAGSVLAVTVAIAMLGPFLAPHATGATVGRPFDPQGPGLLGTGAVGRDVWSRLLHSGQRLVVIPILITVLSTLVGASLGLVMAASRRASRVLRALDLLIAFPPVVLLLILLYRFGGSLVVIGVAVVLLNAPYVARYIRAASEPVLASGFVQHAVLIGDRRWTILRREVLPNVAGPMLAHAALGVSGTIYVVAAAGFLGFGPASPTTDWAGMVNEGLAGIDLNVWAVVAPAAAIAGLTVPVNLLADRIAQRWGGPT